MGRVLVTGGAGFIGLHLVHRLIAQGEEVIVLDDLSNSSRANLHPKAEFVGGDLLSVDLDDLVRGVTSIFHLAARVSVQECISDWMGGHRINLGGTIAVLQAAQRAGNIPVIYASSAAIYGNRSGMACREDALPLPISPYAADKLACEHQASAMAEIHGLPSVGLRFFNVYGPGQEPGSPYAGVISKFCANRMAGRPHVIFGDGQQTRDFIYVADIVEGMLAARAHIQTRPEALVFNLCTGVETSLLDLARQIDRVAGDTETLIDHQPPRSGDIRSSLGSPDAARNEMGFTATTGIESGLAALWQSLKP